MAKADVLKNAATSSTLARCMGMSSKSLTSIDVGEAEKAEMSLEGVYLKVCPRSIRCWGIDRSATPEPARF